MKDNNFFCIKRFLKIIRQDFLANIWKILLFSEALWGILVISLTFFYGDDRNFNPNTKFYPIIFTMLGLFVTSISFGELNNSVKGVIFLTFPTSQMERFLSRLLYSTVGYLVLVSLVFYAASLGAYWLGYYLFEQEQIIFNIFTPSMSFTLVLFILLHSIFFFGSIYFRRVSFLKMILVISALFFIVSFIKLFEFQLYFWDYTQFKLSFSGKMIPLNKEWVFDSTSLMKYSKNVKALLSVNSIYIMDFIIAPFFILLSYLRLKETEL